MDKRIVVVGAGAIGGYTGGNLAHNGFDVTIVDPWPEHVEAIRRDGLSLEGITPEESVVAHPKMLHLTELQHLAKERPIDIAFISVKSYDTEWAATMIRQYLAPTGTFFLGVFVYHEPFTRNHLITFALIWIALAIFTGEAVVRWRRRSTPGMAMPVTH